MRSFARIAAPFAIAIAALIGLGAGTGSAATSMNDALRTEPTNEVISDIASEVRRQLSSIDESLTLNTAVGVTPAALGNTVIGTSYIEGLRTQSSLAPIAAIAVMGVKSITAVGLTADQSICLVGDVVHQFNLAFSVTQSNSDLIAMRDVVVNEYAGVPVNTVVQAYWMGHDKGRKACGI